MFRPRYTAAPLLTLAAIALSAMLSHQTTARDAADAAAKPDVSKIFGKIQFVDSFPDYKVKVVSSFEDLRVQKVCSFPNSPGKWQVVTSFPDYKIQLVDSFPDFTVRYVSSFPGVR